MFMKSIPIQILKYYNFGASRFDLLKHMHCSSYFHGSKDITKILIIERIEL